MRRGGSGGIERSVLTVLEGRFRGARSSRADRFLPGASDFFPPLAKGGLGGVVPAERSPGTRFRGGWTRRDLARRMLRRRLRGPPLRSKLLIMLCPPPLTPPSQGGKRRAVLGVGPVSVSSRHDGMNKRLARTVASRNVDMCELPRGVGFRCEIITKIGPDESTSDNRFSLPPPRRQVNRGAGFRRHSRAHVSGPRRSQETDGCWLPSTI